MTRQADRLRAVRERLANLERPEELRLDVAHAFNLTPEEFAERMPGCPAVLIIKPAAARRVRKSPR